MGSHNSIRNFLFLILSVVLVPVFSSAVSICEELPFPYKGIEDNRGVFLLNQESGEIDPFYHKLMEDGKYMFSQGNYTGAVENLTIAAFGFLDQPAYLFECYGYLMISHYESGERDKAKEYFDKIKLFGLENNLQNTSPSAEMVVKYYNISKIFEAGGSAGGQDFMAVVKKSFYYSLPQEQRKREMQELKRAIKSNKTDAAAYLKLSEIYLVENDIEKARKTLVQLMSFQKENGMANFWLGLVFLKEKKEESAIPYFRLSEQWLDNVDVFYELGIIYFELNSFRDANRVFLNVEERNKGYKETARYLLLLEKIEQGR